MNDTRADLEKNDSALVELLAHRFGILHELAGVSRTESTAALLTRQHEWERRVAARLAEEDLREKVLGVMKEVWSASRIMLLPQGLRIACLGPPGTFSHIVAIYLFGPNCEFQMKLDVDEVLDLVATRRCDYGVVAVMNSQQGLISENLEPIQRAVINGINACDEQEMPIEHTLMGIGPLPEVRIVYSHHQALKQCRRNLELLRKEVGALQIIPVESTSEAARIVAADPTRQSAAIVHRYTGEGRGLALLRDPFEDEPGNVTRFLVVTAGDHLPPSTENDRTSFFLKLRDPNLPGRLLGVLQDLQSFNLTSILSYPTRILAGRYVEHIFFIELEGHRDDSTVQSAITRLRDRCEQGYPLVLGSYPRATTRCSISLRNR